MLRVPRQRSQQRKPRFPNFPGQEWQPDFDHILGAFGHRAPDGEAQGDLWCEMDETFQRRDAVVAYLFQPLECTGESLPDCWTLSGVV